MVLLPNMGWRPDVGCLDRSQAVAELELESKKSPAAMTRCFRPRAEF